MFTGIVETTGIITEILTSGSNKSFWIKSPISPELKPDQSVNHNGACLTIEELKENMHRVTAIAETLEKTNLGSWRVGDLVNLERSLNLNSRLDGHLVQGHVDATAVCVSKKTKEGSCEFEFSFPKKFSNLVIEKGSICIDGISLTAFDVGKKSFKVAIIPYTLEHTNIKVVEKGTEVNVEFDVIGKYILRSLSKK
jgi:riboflavin synthase